MSEQEEKEVTEVSMPQPVPAPIPVVRQAPLAIQTTEDSAGVTRVNISY